jgi:hypothetical protein
VSVKRRAPFKPPQSFPIVEMAFPVRPRFALDPPVPNSAAALGLGPPPPPINDRLARRIGLGVLGTVASIVWMWLLTPPPL